MFKFTFWMPFFFLFEGTSDIVLLFDILFVILNPPDGTNLTCLTCFSKALSFVTIHCISGGDSTVWKISLWLIKHYNYLLFLLLKLFESTVVISLILPCRLSIFLCALLILELIRKWFCSTSMTLPVTFCNCLVMSSCPLASVRVFSSISFWTTPRITLIVCILWLVFCSLCLISSSLFAIHGNFVYCCKICKWYKYDISRE